AWPRRRSAGPSASGTSRRPGATSDPTTESRRPRAREDGLVTWCLAIARATDYFDSGAFLADLTRRVAFRTESGVAGHRPDPLAYLEQEMVPAARRLGAGAPGSTRGR